MQPAEFMVTLQSKMQMTKQRFRDNHVSIVVWSDEDKCHTSMFSLLQQHAPTGCCHSDDKPSPVCKHHSHNHYHKIDFLWFSLKENLWQWLRKVVFFHCPTNERKQSNSIVIFTYNTQDAADNTDKHPFDSLGQSGQANTRKVKLIWILMKHETI